METTKLASYATAQTEAMGASVQQGELAPATRKIRWESLDDVVVGYAEVNGQERPVCSVGDPYFNGLIAFRPLDMFDNDHFVVQREIHTRVKDLVEEAEICSEDAVIEAAEYYFANFDCIPLDEPDRNTIADYRIVGTGLDEQGVEYQLFFEHIEWLEEDDRPATEDLPIFHEGWFWAPWDHNSWNLHTPTWQKAGRLEKDGDAWLGNGVQFPEPFQAAGYVLACTMSLKQVLAMTDKAEGVA